MIAAVPATDFDLGCGPGSIAIRIAQRVRVQVTAVDLNPPFIQRAMTSAALNDLLGSMTFIEGNVGEYTTQRIDAVICMGLSHALGSPGEAIRGIRSTTCCPGTSPPSSAAIPFNRTETHPSRQCPQLEVVDAIPSPTTFKGIPSTRSRQGAYAFPVSCL